MELSLWDTSGNPSSFAYVVCDVLAALRGNCSCPVNVMSVCLLQKAALASVCFPSHGIFYFRIKNETFKCSMPPKAQKKTSWSLLDPPLMQRHTGCALVELQTHIFHRLHFFYFVFLDVAGYKRQTDLQVLYRVFFFSFAVVVLPRVLQ